MLVKSLTVVLLAAMLMMSTGCATARVAYNAQTGTCTVKTTSVVRTLDASCDIMGDVVMLHVEHKKMSFNFANFLIGAAGYLAGILPAL